MSNKWDSKAWQRIKKKSKDPHAQEKERPGFLRRKRPTGKLTDAERHSNVEAAYKRTTRDGKLVMQGAAGRMSDGTLENVERAAKRVSPIRPEFVKRRPKRD